MAYRKSKDYRKRDLGGTGTEGGRPRRGLMWGGATVVVIAILIIFAVSQAGSGGENTLGSSADRRVAAPDFQLTVYQGAHVLGGEELKFSDVFRQGKPLVLNFWAGLCPPCRAEMPGFQEVYNESKDQFILLGMDIGPFIGLGSREDGRNLLRELNITYPAATTFEASIVTQYQIRGMPTTVFLTSNGEIVDTYAGLLDERTFRDKLQELLQAPGGP